MPDRTQNQPAECRQNVEIYGLLCITLRHGLSNSGKAAYVRRTSVDGAKRRKKKMMDYSRTEASGKLGAHNN